MHPNQKSLQHDEQGAHAKNADAEHAPAGQLEPTDFGRPTTCTEGVKAPAHSFATDHWLEPMSNCTTFMLVTRPAVQPPSKKHSSQVATGESPVQGVWEEALEFDQATGSEEDNDGEEVDVQGEPCLDVL